MSELGISSVGGFMCCALCCLAYIGCLAPFYVAKQKLWPNFVASKATGQGQGKQGAGEGACNKWDICQLLLLLPSMLLPLLLLSSMLLAAIKTRKNVYFAKAPSFFCLFLSSSFYPCPLSLSLACCCSFCLSPFCLLAWTFAPCPSSFMRKSA